MSENIVLHTNESVNRFGIEPALVESTIINAKVTYKVHFAMSLTEEDKKLLQLYSLQHGQTAAATVHQWIQLHCK